MHESILGTEKISKLIFKLAVPMIIAQVINMLYNIVDRIFLGHLQGEGTMALTGVGLCLPIITIINACIYLISMGGAPRAAIKMGEEDFDAAEKIMGNSYCALLILSLFLTILVRIFGRKFLLIFGASQDTLEYGYAYLSIYVLGTIFNMTTFGMNPFISTQGFATISLCTVLISAGLNIILDPIFIYSLNLGVKGAALATIISQCISSIWIICFLTGRKSLIRLRRKNLHLNKGIIIPVIMLGVSPFVMQVTESILNISFNSSLAKYGGDIFVGVMTVLTSINQILWLPVSGLSQGIQPITSFNYGAKQIDRVRRAFKIHISLALSWAFSLWLLIQLFPTFFVGIFTSDPVLIEKTIWALRIYLALGFSMSIQSTCQQTFVALGQAKISLLLALLRKIILLIPLIYILPIFFENKVFAVFVAEPIADFLAVVITFTVFITSFGKILNKKVAEI